VITHEPTQSQGKREVIFPNGNKAQIIAPALGTKADEILKSLNIAQPKAVLLLAGGAGNFEEMLHSRLTQLFSRGIARAAANIGAVIVDGGTQAGVMAMMGNGVADRGYKTSLIGVAPATRVTYPGGPPENSNSFPLDANHSHFVLVDCADWGGESATMSELASTLAKDIPIVTLVVNGGNATKQEVLLAVRRGWPVIVVKGSGGTADEIAKLYEEKPAFIQNPTLAEILDDGNIHLFKLTDTVGEMERLILLLLETKNDTSPLKQAWERFAIYDECAIRQQKTFLRLQMFIVMLGVLGTFLALLYTTLKYNNGLVGLGWLNETFHYTILVVPVLAAILLAASNRFNPGNKWVLLRASAESLKREIYRYRCRSGIYSEARTARASRESKLANRLEFISHQLMQTEVNLSYLPGYKGQIPPENSGAVGDEGMGFLTPDSYVAYRLLDQLRYFRRKTKGMERRLTIMQWLIYIVGGVGTVLAAIGYELWIALTASLVTAFGTYLQYMQTESQLVKFNQAVTDLENIRAWWTALSIEKQADQDNIDLLVDSTEKILEREHAGWAQQMQDAFAELREQQAKEAEKQQAGKKSDKDTPRTQNF